MKRVLQEIGKAALVAAFGVLANKLGERLFPAPPAPAPAPQKRKRRASR